MEEYLVPTADSITEFTERRSRFIGHIWHTETEEAAIAQIKKMREQHWDATHNVYAYIIRDGATRYSDDGEPQGTAGMPVLDVLRKAGLFNVCCVVTRYFGGILLGAGGLVRAYSRSAADAVAAAGISVKRVWTGFQIVCPYHLYERLLRELLSFGGIVEHTDYGAEITLRVLLPKEQADRFLVKAADLSAGKLTCVPLGDEYRAFPAERNQEGL